MKMVTIFRSAVIVDACLYSVQIILPYFDGPWLTEKELDVLSYGG